MNSETVIVVGGTGMLGQATIKIIAPHFRVSELRRPGNDKPGGPDVRHVDLFDTALIKDFLRDATTILYFPSFSTPSKSPTDARHELHVTTTALVNLIEAAALAGSNPHLVFSSTAGAMYQDTLIASDETTPPAPISSYGLGKQICEDILRFYARVGKISYTILRLSNLYGQPGPRTVRQGAIDRFLDNAISGQLSSIWSEGGSTRDYLFVDDAARAVEAVLRNPDRARNAMFNVACGVATSMRDVLAIIDRVTQGRHKFVLDTERFSGPVHTAIDASLFRATFPNWPVPVQIERGVELAWQRKLAAMTAGHTI